MGKNRTYLLASVFAATIVVSLLAYFRMDASKTEAAVKTAELEQSRSLVNQMPSREDHPGSAEKKLNDPEMNRWIRDAAGQAGVPEGAGVGLQRIEPRRPVRIPGTEYLETEVPLRLEQVDLDQLVRFLRTLSADDPSLRVKSLSLQPPGENDTTPNWNVDVTLAYLSHTPSRGRDDQQQ